jgi:predicted DNA-binding protein (MmcQ/YjbR family)
MPRPSLRARIEAYAREEYGIEPEQLPFNHEDYAVLRHPRNGKWFAVFFVKPRAALGLPGEGVAEVLSFKVPGKKAAARLAATPGFFPGYPSPRWNWLSVALDGSVPLVVCLPTRRCPARNRRPTRCPSRSSPSASPKTAS